MKTPVAVVLTNDAHLVAALVAVHSGVTPLRRAHPDPAQERLFFELLAECLQQGRVPERFVEAQISAQNLRADAFEALERVCYRRAGSVAQCGPTMFEEFGIDAERLMAPRATVSLGAASRWLCRHAPRRR